MQTSTENKCIEGQLPEIMLRIVSQMNPVDGTLKINDSRYIRGRTAQPYKRKRRNISAHRPLPTYWSI